MAIRNRSREQLLRPEYKTLDAGFKEEVQAGINCSPFEAEAEANYLSAFARCVQPVRREMRVGQSAFLLEDSPGLDVTAGRRCYDEKNERPAAEASSSQVRPGRLGASDIARAVCFIAKDPRILSWRPFAKCREEIAGETSRSRGKLPLS